MVAELFGLGGAFSSTLNRLPSLSRGNLYKWTERVITALLDIENDHVYWPDAAERREIAADFEDRGVPGGCVGSRRLSYRSGR